MNAEVMPHSPTAERALLGAILINPETFTGLRVEAEQFYIERNRFIFQAMAALRRTGQAVDYVSVCAYLDKAGQLDQIGGPAYITGLINDCQSSLNADTYAGIILERARRRRVIDVARGLTQAAFEDDTALEAAVADGMDRLSRVVVSADGGARPFSAFVSEVYDEVAAAIENPRDFYGIKTGVLDYDKITLGLQREEVVKLTGDPGVGKTLLALQMARGMADPKIGNTPGVIYSLEMSGRALARRQLSALSNIETYRMRQGKIKDEEFAAFVQAVDYLSGLPIYLCDRTITTAEMRADLERLKASYGVGWVMVDYEGLLADAGRDENDRTKILSARVHAIVKELRLAGLVIDTMNKTGIDNADAGKGNLSGSAGKIYDADAIWFLKQTDDPDIVVCQLKKMREGAPHRAFKLRRKPGFPEFQAVAGGSK